MSCHAVNIASLCVSVIQAATNALVQRTVTHFPANTVDGPRKAPAAKCCCEATPGNDTHGDWLAFPGDHEIRGVLYRRWVFTCPRIAFREIWPARVRGPASASG